MMTFNAFLASAADAAAPPDGLSEILVALWWAEKGDWHASHDVAQDIPSADGSWVHAYLHRVEGDLGNAGYWYARARREMPSVSVEEERRDLIRHFLTTTS